MLEKVSLVRGDITAQRADAIVNAANHTLLGGGGVDGAIHRAAGPELLAECKALHGCGTGEAKHTKAYHLKAKYIVHTVGPVWHGGERSERQQLQMCYENSLKLAAELDCRSIVFPSISTGAYHFPIQLAAPIALGSIAHILPCFPEIESVTMVLFTNEDFLVYREALEKLRESTHRT